MSNTPVENRPTDSPGWSEASWQTEFEECPLMVGEASPDCCERCRYFVFTMPDRGEGICRRYPPNAAANHCYPRVETSAWCGEFSYRRVHG